MTKLNRIRRAVANLAVEDRRDFQRIDASPAIYDDGRWLEPSLALVNAPRYA